jgi:hypothetical protein
MYANSLAMRIVINIKPETEIELIRPAEMHGMALDAYVVSLLEQATVTRN